jgi:hypothetical protein
MHFYADAFLFSEAKTFSPNEPGTTNAKLNWRLSAPSAGIFLL